MKKMRVIGKEVNRKDGRSKTDGSLKYMADIQLEGMLYGQLVHPPIPHARILSIDTSAAEQVPGVMRWAPPSENAPRSNADACPAKA